MALVLGGLAYYYFGGYAKKVQELHADALKRVHTSSEQTFRASQTSLVFDKNKKLIANLKGEKDVYYLQYEEIPPTVINAIVSIEDKKFYKHNGIDYKAIMRAGLAMIRNGEVTQGGSTITQQLSRTIFLNNEKTWQRKIEEMFIALELEKIYNKDQIMEFYLNNIYFANGYYGIEAASKGYFNKEITQLDLSQIAYLCAIPNNPSLYDPVKQHGHTIQRRDRILRNMWQDGVIADAEYDKAKAEKIKLERSKSKKNDYVETYTYSCAIRELMKARGFQFYSDFGSEEEKDTYKEAYNQLYRECQDSLYTAGYRIYTSIDLNMQKELQKTIDKELAGYNQKSEEGIYQLQSAGVCIDNQTGYVNAIVGGRSQKQSGYTLNRGYQSFRQPGSAIKPLIVYTPQLERMYTPDTIVEDKKIEDGPGASSYLGKITLRRAVELSRNSVAWQLLDELKPGVGLEYLLHMNFSKIDAEDYRLTSALGGLTNGTSPLEMAAAYETLENDGFYREPTCIVRITTADGEEILGTEPKEEPVYKENAARMMTDILRGVFVRGTAQGLELDNMPCAGKTGTTNENKDGWFVGYTNYYTTSIWVGYDTPKEMDGLQGGTFPGKIWHDFMTAIHEELPPIDFLPYVE